MHPLVSNFFHLGNERIAERYVHLNPSVDAAALKRLLSSSPRLFRWAGCDLFHVTSSQGNNRMVVVETNSCPSGQKSMPLLDVHKEMGGYLRVIQTAFADMVKGREPSEGRLCVLFDKNEMEASGYAHALASHFGEEVLLTQCLHGAAKDPCNPHLRWVDSYLEVLHEGAWHRIRGCFRYVTQKPWKEIGHKTATAFLNPIAVCLAGGRNKALASVAYNELNKEIAQYGLEIHVPQTNHDVRKEDIPALVKQMGGHAVIKVPYSNAGQGVYTITRQEELEDFMALDFSYNKFVVQSLVGNHKWSSKETEGKFFHTGTIPNAKNETFAGDLRVMVAGSEGGFQPIALYGRRAEKPLCVSIQECEYTTWDMLGTNLSIKDEHGNWTTDPTRLMLMDVHDFNTLGISIDDLIDAYIQSVLATIAIDRMAQRLLKSDGSFDIELFGQLNPDEALIGEISP